MPKPTKAVQAEILTAVRELMERQQKPGFIKRAVSSKFDLNPRSVERYMRCAREEMISETDLPVEHHRSDAYAFLKDQIRDRSLTPRERHAAQKSLIKLLALNKQSEKAAPKAGLDLTLEQLQGLSQVELNQLIEKLSNACKTD